MTRDATVAAQESDALPEAFDAMVIQQILQTHHGTQGGLVAILEAIQNACGYLPAEALRIVADRTGRSLVDVYGIATFYRSFSLEPRGKHIISACLGTACHVRGAARVVEEFERQLGVRAGETTPDKEFTLETVNCLGACALGPVVVVDGHYVSKVGRSKVKGLLDSALAGFADAGVAQDKRVFPIDVSCPRCNHTLMDKAVPIDGNPSIRVTVRFDRRHSWLRLSSLYGSYSTMTEHEVPEGTVAGFYCPHCHRHLIAPMACSMCRAPMVPMVVRDGGVVQICSRRGCRNHLLDLV